MNDNKKKPRKGTHTNIQHEKWITKRADKTLYHIRRLGLYIRGLKVCMECVVEDRYNKLLVFGMSHEIVTKVLLSRNVE